MRNRKGRTSYRYVVLVEYDGYDPRFDHRLDRIVMQDCGFEDHFTGSGFDGSRRDLSWAFADPGTAHAVSRTLRPHRRPGMTVHVCDRGRGSL